MLLADELKGCQQLRHRLLPQLPAHNDVRLAVCDDLVGDRRQECAHLCTVTVVPASPRCLVRMYLVYLKYWTLILCP